MAGNRRLRHPRNVRRHRAALDRACRSSYTPISIRKYQIDQETHSSFLQAVYAKDSKSRDSLGFIIIPNYRSVARYDEVHFPRENVEKSTVFDLVYKYLDKCANKDMKSRQRNCACNQFNKRHTRKKDIHEYDVGTIRRNFDEEIRGDDGERSRSHLNKNVLSKRVSRSSSRECVADYAKAVCDGRRRAKLYVREALLYGLESGLLIPTDRRKNVLRVSRKLGTFLSKNAKDNEYWSNFANQQY